MVESNKDLNIIASEISANLRKLVSSLPTGERLSSLEYDHDQSEWVAASARWSEEDLSSRSIVGYIQPGGEAMSPSGAWVTVARATGSTIADAIKNLVEDRTK